RYGQRRQWSTPPENHRGALRASREATKLAVIEARPTANSSTGAGFWPALVANCLRWELRLCDWFCSTRPSIEYAATEKSSPRALSWRVAKASSLNHPRLHRGHFSGHFLDTRPLNSSNLLIYWRPQGDS